jgi:hypothetical protein
MANIPIRDIPGAVVDSPNPNDLIAIDNGILMQKTTIGNSVLTTLPLASQAEAEAGTDNFKRISALRVKQSIASQVGVTLASNAQGSKADSAVQSVNGKTGSAVALDKSDVGLGNVDNTSDADKPISNATQTALNGKATTAQGDKADSAVQSVNGKSGNSVTLVKGDVGLGNVDNTSDVNKPISTATQTALDGKVPTSSPRLIPAGGLVNQVLGKSSISDYATEWVDISQVDSSIIGLNYVHGLITSKSSGFVISASEGTIRGNGLIVSNSAPFTKNLNDPWAAGSGNGGRLDAAAVAASTTYHCQALRKDSDGTFDWGYSLLPIPATVPVGYTWVGRFWSVYTNSDATSIMDYLQRDNRCYINLVEWFRTTTSLAAALYTIAEGIAVPSGILTNIIVNLKAIASTSADSGVDVYDADGLPFSVSSISVYAGNGGSAARGYASGVATTNNARQVGIAVGISGTGLAIFDIGGWDDFTLNRIY